MKKLIDKEKLFVNFYVQYWNVRRAWVEAGYSEKATMAAVVRLFKQERIQIAIEEAIGERIDRTLIDQDYVLHTTQEIIERCLEYKPVFQKGAPLFYKDGDEMKPLQEFDASGALKGLELIAKHLNMFNDVHSITNNSFAFDLSKLNKEQLDALGRGILPEGQKYVSAEDNGVDSTEQ